MKDYINIVLCTTKVLLIFRIMLLDLKLLYLLFGPQDYHLRAGGSDGLRALQDSAGPDGGGGGEDDGFTPRHL